MAAQVSDGGGGAAPPRAVLLDALGTLLALEPPAPLLRAALREHAGLEVGEQEAQTAILAEIGYYRAHLMDGRDADSLADLRRRAAEAMRAALPAAAAAIPVERLVAALLAALRFTPFPDVVPALRALRARGARLVVVSNWDVSLHQVLELTGLAPLVDGAVTSAELDTAKPDPAIFAAGLELAGVTPAEALHAGDSLAEDVAGARAAGIEAVYVHRAAGDPPAGVRAVRALTELPGAG